MLGETRHADRGNSMSHFAVRCASLIKSRSKFSAARVASRSAPFPAAALARFRRKPCRPEREYAYTSEVWIVDQEYFSTNNVATATAAGCVINEDWIGRAVVISAAGVIDMLTSPQLEASIGASMDKQPAAVIVDFSDVDFLASAGMGVLVAARDRAAGTTGFAVVANGPATSRPLKLVGLADVIGMYSTLEEARAALGV